LKNAKLFSAAILSLGLASNAPNARAEDSLTQNPVYQTNCSKCHGKTAEGRFMAGPSLASEKTKALSPDDVRNIISKGKHRMPKFEGKLSSSDIDALVDQIKAQKK